MCGEHCISPDTNIEGPIARFLETMCFVSVGGVDRYAVSAVLESECRIDNEPFGAADAQIWMDDDNVRTLKARHCDRRAALRELARPQLRCKGSDCGFSSEGSVLVMNVAATDHVASCDT